MQTDLPQSFLAKHINCTMEFMFMETEASRARRVRAELDFRLSEMLRPGPEIRCGAPLTCEEQFESSALFRMLVRLKVADETFETFDDLALFDDDDIEALSDLPEFQELQELQACELEAPDVDDDAFEKNLPRIASATKRRRFSDARLWSTVIAALELWQEPRGVREEPREPREAREEPRKLSFRPEARNKLPSSEALARVMPPSLRESQYPGVEESLASAGAFTARTGFVLLEVTHEYMANILAQAKAVLDAMMAPDAERALVVCHLQKRLHMKHDPAEGKGRVRYFSHPYFTDDIVLKALAAKSAGRQQSRPPALRSASDAKTVDSVTLAAFALVISLRTGAPIIIGSGA